MTISRWLFVVIAASLSSLAAVAPAGAESRQTNFTLSVGNQTFAALMQQAETLAESLLKQAFSQNPSLTEVSVTITGEHNGQEVPLLSSRVSGKNWQKQPKIKFWTTYTSNSAILLGFSRPRLSAPVIKQPAFNSVAASKLDIEPNFYR